MGWLADVTERLKKVRLKSVKVKVVKSLHNSLWGFDT
jgi:hypothetical protein